MYIFIICVNLSLSPKFQFSVSETRKKINWHKYSVLFNTCIHIILHMSIFFHNTSFLNRNICKADRKVKKKCGWSQGKEGLAIIPCPSLCLSDHYHRAKDWGENCLRWCKLWILRTVFTHFSSAMEGVGSEVSLKIRVSDSRVYFYFGNVTVKDSVEYEEENRSEFTSGGDSRIFRQVILFTCIEMLYCVWVWSLYIMLLSCTFSKNICAI